MHTLHDASLKGKRVLYRPDYNVPVKGGEIQDPFRITATFPTLDYLMEQGAKIIIASHLGRPEGHVMEEFSLRPVAEFLADHYHNRTVRLAHQIYLDEITDTTKRMKAGDILVLPNVRFFEGEEKNNQEFARNLAAVADVYVNDAFACSHRAHASIVGPPHFLPSYPGFLMEKELENLGLLLQDPPRPFVVIMGGAKVSDKIDVIKSLGRIADTILIGGAMANTFLLAQGEKIGESKAEPDKRHVAEQLMHEFGNKLFLAPDYVKEGEGAHFRYLDIGPKAVEQFKERMKDAKLVFWNGSLGYTEEAPYDKGSTEIAKFLAESTAKTVVAGGDTVELISRLDLHEKFDFISTGGGAALEFLGSGGKLPGIEALEHGK